MSATAFPDLLLSATEVATMSTLDGTGGVAGAVYMPAELMVPTVVLPPGTASTLQVTAVLLVPVTLAVYTCVPPGAKVADGGVTVTVMFCVGVGAGAGVELPDPESPPPPQERATVESDSRTRMSNRVARYPNFIEPL